jgi:hypothetical protein
LVVTDEQKPPQKPPLRLVPRPPEDGVASPAIAAVVDPLAPVEVALEPQDATVFQLGHSRLQSAQLQVQVAQLHAQNRQNEFNSLLNQVQVKYQEGGKFVMTSIDIDRGVVVRHPAAG